MCISDYRIGRLIRSVPKDIAMTPGQVLTIVANPQRVGLDIFVATDTPTGFSVFIVAVEDCIIDPPAVVPTRYSYRMTKDGDLPTRRFTVNNGDAAGHHVTVIEYIIPEAALTDAIQNYERQNR